tara:strand:- start:874 stop:1134 length:261 start_codon:yes stop_codon:yes gene_type:complete
MSYEEDEKYIYENGDCDVMEDYYICETILWEARDKIDPPYKDYVMFASSDPETNVSHLVNEMDIDLEDISVVIIGGHETIWYKKEE